jgi:amino acid adenylation domain-containing protein
MSEPWKDGDPAGMPPGAIAIVGMAGRFPGAQNIDEFWRNLCAGVESISRFDDAELEDSFSAEIRNAANFVKARPILENVDLFDAGFFGMYAREAELTDPQHRIFLECSWEALENAGYDPAAYRGAIGVFAGSSINTYFLNNVCADRRTIEEFTSSYQVGCYPMLLGAGQDFLSTRVSYKLDLKGPSLTLQTACSTSLLAVAQACQSLLLYQADMALAGGVSVTFPQKRGYQHLEGGMVSADGRCRPFDADASGTIFGSGAGVVLLKRLEDALADRDHIYAVIRGCGTNNDGAAKVGFTAPSVEGQASAIEMALASAGVDARSISYVECHGTATPLGDPIEVGGLTKAFGASTTDRQFCALGSVKGNIGHLDAAAGVTGLIKTALSLQHRTLPPSLHYRRSNPQIDFPSTPFYVNAALNPWPESAGPRRAGVSAFGLGGTNVHVVLEEAPPRAEAQAGESDVAPQLLVLSARTSSALNAARKNLAAHLKGRPTAELAGVAYTLQTGRRAFEHRLAVAARDVAGAVAKLDDPAGAGVYTGSMLKGRSRVVFMFPGQGSQYPDMGRDLYEREPEFRTHIEHCARILKPIMGEDLLELLYPAVNSAEAKQRLMATIAAQPAIFSVEYALAKLWQSLGILPDAMIGHSIGEFVAAVIAGVLTLEDALMVVAERGRLMQALPGGAMLAVRQAEAQVRPLLTAELAIAAINGPNLCVVAGPYAAVDAFEKDLTVRSIVSRRLHTSHAFHSAMVDAVVEPLRAAVNTVTLRPPSIPYVSCVSGDWIRDEQATSPQYWASHAREAVRFNDGVQAACAGEGAILLEIGPGNTLATLALQSTRGRNIPVISSMQDVERSRDDQECLLEALGRVWILGAAPDWNKLHDLPVERVALPTYPFERARHWIDAPVSQNVVATEMAPDARPHNEISPPILPQEVNAMNQSSVDDRNPEVRAKIAAILEDLSGERPESIDSDVSFLEMGYDSLFLTQVVQKIDQQLRVKTTFRQLLGDHSTIPTLAAYLVTQMPKAAPAAAPAVARATAAVSTAAAPTALLRPVPATTAATSSASSGVEGIFRDQLQAMSELINRQFEMLQSLGAAAPPIAAAPAQAPSKPASDGSATPAEAPRSALFQMYKPSKKPADGGINAEQHRHIDALIAQTVARTPGSKRNTAAYRAVSADPRVAAGFRSEWKEMVYPIVVNKAAGSKLYDVDGNEYVDLVNGYGQTALGHSPDFVVKAVKEQLDKGFAIGPQAELTGQVAALFCELTGNERMAFCNTGSEAVMAAMRVARTVTGREKIVIFNGDYHGQFDEVLVKGVQKPGANPRSMPVAPGIPSSTAQNMVVLEYGTPQTLQWIRENAHDIAAVITEPVQSRHPNLRPYDFLREVRAITEASGAAFVMDEVVTGFRVHMGGMQAITGIRADLATYGKIVGGGLPVGCLAGKAKFMDALDGGNWNYGDDSIPETGVTFFAGTFVRHPLLLASAWSVLNHLKSHGPALQENLTAATARLVDRINKMFASRDIATKLETFASWFYFNFHNEHPLATLFYYHMRARGIHIQEGFPCFLTTAHSDADFERIYEAFEGSVAALQSVGILGGRREALAAAGTSTAAPQSAAAPVPLTESQLEIWLSAQLGDEASCAFNESVSLRMRGQLNESALQAAISLVVARHDALRATFSPTGEELRISPAQSVVQYPFIDLSGQTNAEAELAYAHLVDSDARTAFDLVKGPLIRGHLVKLAVDSHALMLTAHHIICDGWSINVIVNELAEIYAALCRGETPQMQTALPFSDYARQQAARSPADLAKTEAFWLDQFNTPAQPLELPTDRARPALRSFSGASRCRRIDTALYQAVKKAGARQGSTLFVTLLAAFQAFMGRLSNQDEVVVGVPTAGQSLLEDQILVGHCVNFLPIRGTWTRDTKVSEFLAAMAKRVLDAYEHQNYTFGTLVRKLELPREPGRLPLAEVQFNLERLADRMELPNLSIDVTPNAKAHVNFDLFLNVIESSDGLRMDCDYNTDLFDEATVDHWLNCYQALLESIVADAAQPVCTASCLPASDRELLAKINDTRADFPRDRSVHEFIEMQALAKPTAVAAQFGDTSLSYQALDRRANRLANVLRERIGSPEKTGRLVGVSVDRSLDMLVALIAVLKAGCAYVPLDPTHPEARLRYILGEAKVAALISDGSENASLVADGIPLIDMGRDAALIAAASAAPPTVKAAPDSLAYVMYTSGSTGLPKGVEVTHRSLVNLLTAMAREPGLDRSDVFFSVTTISFDIAGLELYLPLTVGASVVIAAREEVVDGFALVRHLNECGATAMQATPATWRLLLEAGFRAKHGFKMLCGGEALPRDLANRLLQGDGVLWNMYGPTETTIWSSCCQVTTGSAPITVGKPIANTQFYVLDRHDQPLPQGIPGQLHIGGEGVARGYYERGQLTAERFVKNPFEPGRMYRTGDLGRWLADGNLQILGRIDHQIKLRGFRIELGEIEAALTGSEGVSSAAVVLREDTPGAPQLAAYYVETAGKNPTVAALRARLAEQLPDYMVPSAFVRLASLPVTPNGKLDRAALPKPGEDSAAEVFIAPKTALERTLARIWAEVLGAERVGMNDDLLKLGADSIQLFQITARANRMGIKLTAKQLLKHRTIAVLGALPEHSGYENAPDSRSEPSSLAKFKRNRNRGVLPERGLR